MMDISRINHTPYNAYILMGGQSRRFFSDKSIAKLNNRTLTEILYDKISTVAKNTFIVGKDSSSHPFPFIEDKFPIQCALNGIITALNHSDTEWSFVISCDIPLIRIETIQSMAINRSSNIGAVIPIIRKIPQPICSFYRSTVMPHFRESLNQNHYRLSHILEGIKTAYINMQPKTEPEFLNINTSDDLKKAEKTINTK